MRQILLFLGLGLLVDVGLAGPAKKWGPRNLKSLVTFGDSYTDDSRLNYFTEHKGEAPPVGWVQPVVRTTIQQTIREINIPSANSMPKRTTNPPPEATTGATMSRKRPTPTATTTPSAAQSARTRSPRAHTPASTPRSPPYWSTKFLLSSQTANTRSHRRGKSSSIYPPMRRSTLSGSAPTTSVMTRSSPIRRLLASQSRTT